MRLQRVWQHRISSGYCFFRLLLLAALLLAAGCADEGGLNEAEPDPMEMKRHYLSPSQTYQLSSAVRWVAPETEDGEPSPLVIGSNVYQLPDELREGLEVEEDALSLPYRGRTYLKNRAPGDIVILEGEPSPWRRITQVREEGGRLIWQTERAEIQEVFERAHFHIQVDTSQIDPEELPQVDLAAPYLRPDETPELITRTFASEQKCPAPPACESYQSKRCVLKDNPDIICEPDGETKKSCSKRTKKIKGGDGKCVEREAPDCVVADSPSTACPKDKQDTCDEPNGYCKRLKHWGAQYDSQRFKTYRSLSGGDRDVQDFSCEDYAGAKYLLMAPMQGGSPYCDTEEVGACASSESAGVTCKDTLWSGDCEQNGDSCSTGSDCCSGNCQSGQCVANEHGYCAAACVRENIERPTDPAKDEEGGIGGMIKGLVMSKLGEVGIEKLNVDAKFKPEVTIDIRIENFSLDRITVGFGADYFLKLGVDFNFEKKFEKELSKKGNKELFAFTIMGYPFSVDLLYGFKAYASVQVKGELKPAYYLYSFRPEDEALWKDVAGEDFPATADEDMPAPGVDSQDPDSQAGFRMGVIYSPTYPCDDYSTDDGYSCEQIGSTRFYTYMRNERESHFEPGLDGSLDVRAGASASLGIGLFDHGVMGATEKGGHLLIGVRPIDLLAKAYAMIDSPLCGFGFGLYYRVFVETGGIKILGINLLEDREFGVFSKRILGFDYDIPDSFVDEDGECPEGQGAWCRFAELFDCGVMPDEPTPTTSGLPCADHAACADEPNNRCIAGQCKKGIDSGELRVAATWQSRQNFNLKVRTPDGRTITRGAQNDGATFADACGDPAAECGAGQLEFSESVRVDISQAEPGDVYTFWVVTDSEVDPSQSVNVDFEVEQEGEAIHSFSTYFANDDRVSAKSGMEGQPPRDPMKFEYVVK